MGQNDDCQVGTGLTSCVTVTAVAGTAYAVQVDGYAGDSGAIRLKVTTLGSW